MSSHGWVAHRIFIIQIISLWMYHTCKYLYCSWYCSVSVMLYLVSQMGKINVARVSNISVIRERSTVCEPCVYIVVYVLGGLPGSALAARCSRIQY